MYADPDSDVQALLDVLPETVRDGISQLLKEKQDTCREGASEDAQAM